jgi:ribosomal-protein-alanine N-acetyltransferase
MRKIEILFETPHLLVRKFEFSDVEQLYRNHSEKAMRKWIPNEYYTDIAEAQNAIQFYRSCVETGHLPYVLAVESKETGELIGDTGINEVDGHTQEVEIGYSISDKFSGRGYATELVEAMSEFADKSFGIRILYGRVLHGNDASARVLTKNGYQFVGEVNGAEDDPFGNGIWIYKKQL